MKIRWFNLFHRGDLHISREFVRKIIPKVKGIDPKTKFSYAHVNDPCLLSDIPDLEYEDANILGLNQFENLNPRLDGTTFNTWYGQQNFKYMNQYGMTLDCLYHAFSDSCEKLWGFTLNDFNLSPGDFIPTIDYNKFYISEAQNWLNQHPETKILVSNGHALSGQAHNFDLTSIVVALAQKHANKTWILTNVEPGWDGVELPPNVVYSHNIIKKPSGSDLNENSFLSTYCDLIIGRASGTYSYAWTQENLLKRKVKFLTFCGPGIIFFNGYNFWNHSLLHGKIDYSAEVIACHDTNPTKVKEVIENHL